jgi:hypothetical protein
MKKIIVFAGFLLIMGACLTGCYKDVIIPHSSDPSAPPQATSFAKDIQPIFTANCALSGCHVAGSETPNLTAGVSYQDLVSGGFVNTVVPSQSTLYLMINGEMEVHIPNAADRQKIYDWIRTGAINN